MSTIVLETSEGDILMHLLGDKAPATVKHVTAAVASGIFDGCTFYRSDFVVQFGLHGTGKSVTPALKVNESTLPGAKSNKKGAVAVAHWDVPDNGSSEFFISLGDNEHLDSAYGGYCVFAEVRLDDERSWATIDAIAKKIASKKVASIKINRIQLQ
jgi:peptidyl-prolyl cis-trans isomerase B (cyclophilin B)